MNPPQRTRNKPLRTYGKRSSSVPEEPPVKKRRTELADAPLSSPKSTPVPSSPIPTAKKRKHAAPSPGDASPKPIKKGSILNFFKPIPTPSPVVSSCPNSDDVRPASTPPSSPPPPIARRKPRFLRFRGGSMPELNTEDPENDHINGPKTEEMEENEARPSLQPRRSSLDNGKGKEKKLSRSNTVQMTLNISTQAAFSECKVCNTVWNPLHPGDVKFHLKQHAAVLRAKRKSEKIEL